jgi:hypothetical protein
MGCLFALLGGLFPRLAVFILWVARPERVDAAFSSFLWPLLGIIFLPFATLIYLLLYTPGRGLRGWAWFWVVLAALLDIGIGGRLSRPPWNFGGGPAVIRRHPPWSVGHRWQSSGRGRPAGPAGAGGR